MIERVLIKVVLKLLGIGDLTYQYYEFKGYRAVKAYISRGVNTR